VSAAGVRRWVPAAILVAGMVTAVGAQAPAASDGWATIDYAALVDGRRLTHSGESISTVLKRLGGRSLPPPGERPADAEAHRILEPLLEPHAFVLPDAIDSTRPLSERPMREVASLWQPGERQPAWVELLRARRYVVESDGAGRFRVFAPWTPVVEAPSETAARQAWVAAWPVLRHVVAAELRRLGGAAGEPDAKPVLRVEVFPYRHDLAHTRFVLGTVPAVVELRDARHLGPRPEIDLEGWRRFLDSGLLLEGGKLEPGGQIRLLGSEGERTPTLLGRPVDLADFAVAYRAVFHGGLAEPYMSLDRALSPHESLVSYGGRLRDTSLGLVSLLCDIRFKTFSMGIDVLRGTDVREEVRDSLEGFRTHLERLSSDPTSRGAAGQQTRLWFYPDDVDLTLSSQGDVLVIRRARMTAASERVEETTWTASETKAPPWTRETIRSINADYSALARSFPELGDLDQTVRLLALFSWLSLARQEGLPVPDLDRLLDVELPPVPTPRRFPQLLAFNALPQTPGPGAVAVVDRTDVGTALDLLEPVSDSPLPARWRLDRALASLDSRRADHAALLGEVAGYDLDALGDDALDLLAYRAERVRMHQLVLTTLPDDRRTALATREKGGEPLRVFSVGIGGVDLSMDSALDRASGRAQTGLFGAAGSAERRPAPTPRRRIAVVRPVAPGEPSGEPVPVGPGPVLPDHGAERDFEQPASGDAPARTRWEVSGADGPDPRARRLTLDGTSGKVAVFERWEDGRLLTYRFERDGGQWTAALLEPVPDTRPTLPSPREAAELPPGLVVIEAVPSDTASDAPGTVEVRLRFADRRIAAPIPRETLQRLVLGRSLDRSRRPLPGLSPLPDTLGEVERVMVYLEPRWLGAPWETHVAAVPGEEDPVRLAAAFRDWWSAETQDAVPQAVVVATDRDRSPERWLGAPRPGQVGLLLLPDDGFPALASRYRDALEPAWTAGPVAAELPAGDLPRVVVLVSGEAPARLGERVRELATDPAMKERYLAVVSLSGPLRTDLVASLAGDNVAAIGLAVVPPVGFVSMVAEIEKTGRVLAAGTRQTRIEELSDLFVWFF
jgi:hypothetical protein